MAKIKLCGLSRFCDIETANRLKPEYIGFVFAPGSRRYVTAAQARELKRVLSPAIQAVGVFASEEPEIVARLLAEHTIDIAQLHSGESEDYMRTLRSLTKAPLIKAFRIDGDDDIAAANKSSADCVLLDSGKGGTGALFDWRLLEKIERPYFLAGGLTAECVGDAVRMLNPYAVDVSSGIETDGAKDKSKMEAFVLAARNIPPAARQTL